MNTIESCNLEAIRFFKKYYIFCKSSDSDNAREVLFSLYSLDDKLKKCGHAGFHPDKDFLALKALRNYATHESELLNESKAISTKNVANIQSQCLTLCLLPIETVKQIKSKLRSKNITNAIDRSFVFYSKYVDIYPSIFNFAVKVHFKLNDLGIEISSPEYDELKQSIEYEKTNNFDHFISGEITVMDGSSIDTFIDQSLIDIQEKNREVESLPVDDDGRRTFVARRQFTDSEKNILSSEDNIKIHLDTLLQNKKIELVNSTNISKGVKRIKELTPFDDFFISVFNSTIS